MNKDWSGDARSIFTCNGARNFATEQREEDDYYATAPKAVEELLVVEQFCNRIWEPACGGGHISNVLMREGFAVKSTDIKDRGYKFQGGWKTSSSLLSKTKNAI